MHSSEHNIIIRDSNNKCIKCRRYICLEFHEEDEQVKQIREEQEADEFAGGFLL